ncbi:hypothetical protein ACLQ2D_02455 [Streptomyces sp. DT199]|uniref:hypothetical protein n=1 Tax=Streptomyces sp. DT199 TaxID=3393421 RepID=UPI003CF9E1D1
MEIRPLEDLRAADDLSLAFNPYGLGGRMKPEDAAEFQQRQIADCDLAKSVAAGTRDSFERLRTVFAYGVLCYDVYTMVGDQALLIYEQALRDRFMEWCAGTITFRPTQAPDVCYTVSSYDNVKKCADRMARQRAKLVVATHAIDFNGMLHGLRLWARAAGLLRGRRSRAVEDALAKLRNYVAHPSGHHVGTPVGAARTVRDLAELINQLWGQATPNGRLYPAPLRREIAVLSWNGSGRTRMEPADALTVPDPVEDQEDDEYQHVVVRAIPFVPGSRWDDAHWAEYDTRYETTDHTVPDGLPVGAGHPGAGPGVAGAGAPRGGQRRLHRPGVPRPGPRTPAAADAAGGGGRAARQRTRRDLACRSGRLSRRRLHARPRLRGSQRRSCPPPR